MPLTLDQYATDYLPTRNLPWPTAPKVEPVKAKPAVPQLPVKAIFWNVYGTLLAVPKGELLFEPELDFVMDVALDKVIKEFNMWQSMSRKPGAPSAYMKELYKKAFDQVRLTNPEIVSEKIWDDVYGKLLKKDYAYDAGQFGPPAEYVKKITYFYHASIQGFGAYPGAADAVRAVAEAGKSNGLLADGQSFTPTQIFKAFREQDPSFEMAVGFPPVLRFLSAEKKAKKSSDAFWKAAVELCRSRGWEPHQVLHVGSSIARDIAPAKKAGFRTALFAGDKASFAATKEQIMDPATKPDALITELPQILEALG
jgi:hypothetical protein